MIALTKPEPVMSDASMERALDWLRDNAKVLGKAKERLIKAEHMLKHIEAIEFQKSDENSAEARKSEARASKRYLAALLEEAKAAGQYETLKAHRESAALRIEVWRSEGANWRAMKL